MAERTRYVDTASTAGGNGTVDTTTGANRAYASASLAEAGEQGNLDSLNENVEFYCRSSVGGADTTALVVAGSTTSVDDFMRFRGNGGKYLLDSTATDKVDLTDAYAKIADFEIDCNGSFGVRIRANGQRVSRCLIHDFNTSTNARAIWTDASGFTWYADNNIIYNGTNGGSFSGGIYNDGATVYCYHNTAYGVYRSFRRVGGTYYVKNCLSQNTTTAGFVGTFHATSTNNISDIAADGASATQGTVVFVNAGANNFHLDPSDTVAKGAGANLSSDAGLAITEDYDGLVFASWDGINVGADQFAVAGGTNITVSASSVSGSYSLSNPTIIAESPDVTISPSLLSASYSISNPQVDSDRIFSVGLLSGSYSISSPTINPPNVVYTDTFDGSGALSAVWIPATGTCVRSSGEFAGTTGQYNAVHRAETFSDNQYSKFVVKQYGIDYILVSVRSNLSGSGWSAYFFNTNGDNSNIRMVNNNVFTILQSVGTHPTSGDTVELRVSGYSLSLLYNDVEVASYDDSANPNRITSGAPGLGSFRSDARMDDWEGGSLGASSIIDVTVQAESLTGTYNLNSPTIETESSIIVESSLLSATFDLSSPIIQTAGSVTVESSLLSGTYSLENVVVETQSSIIIDLPVISAVYGLQSPDILNSTNISLGYISATWFISDGDTAHDITVDLPVISAVYDLQSPQINYDVSITTEILSANYSFVNLQINYGSNIQIGAISGAYSVSNPQVNYGSNIDVGILSGEFDLQDNSISSDIIIETKVLSASYLVSGTTVELSDSVFISVSTLSANYSVSNPQVNYGSGIEIGAISGAYSVSNPQVNYGSNIDVGTLSGGFVLQSPIVDSAGSVSIQAETISANYSSNLPQINTEQILDADIISANYSLSELNVLIDSITQLALLSANYSIENVDITSNQNQSVSVSILSANYELNSTNIISDCLFQVTSISGSYSIQDPSVGAIINETIICEVLSASHLLSSPEINTDSTIEVDLLSANINMNSPIVNYDSVIIVGVLTGSYSLPSPSIGDVGLVLKIRRIQGY